MKQKKEALFNHPFRLAEKRVVGWTWKTDWAASCSKIVEVNGNGETQNCNKS